ncbi:MAG: cysteine dioxygenase family protein [Paracoccus aminovorans]|nr:cysteine dioxygenase family protein [Paracoccus aminovorans]
MDVSQERSARIVELAARIGAIMRDGDSVAALEAAKALLNGFAAQRHLFPAAEFPWPAPPEDSHCYCLYRDGALALYLDLLRQGTDTVPHDHGDSWAIVTSIDGVERHHLYQVEAAQDGPGPATLRKAGQIEIAPGQSVSLRIGGIHAIEAVGSEPAMMLHCYGRGFEDQAGRLEYDLAAGTRSHSIAAAGEIEDYPLHPAVAGR